MKVLDSNIPQPGGSVPLDREWLADREIDVFAGTMFVWRRRYLLSAGLLAGLLIGYLITVPMPREYTATATVVMHHVNTDSTLAPDVLTADGAERLAASSLVQGRVQGEVARQGAPSGEILKYSPTLYRTVDVASAATTNGGVNPKLIPYVPIIGLSVIASTPETARDAANAWAALLVSEAHKIESANRSASVGVILNEYPKALQKLNEQERSLLALKRQQAEALQRTRMNVAVTLRAAELDSNERLIVELEQERKRLTLETRQGEAAIAALEQELKQASTPAMKDPNGGADSVFTTLATRLADARVRQRELSARGTLLGGEVDELRRDGVKLRGALAGAEVAISNLELQQESELLDHEREVATARAAFDKVEDRIGEARILAAGDDERFKIGATAELPTSQSGPRRAGPMAMGAVGGFLVAAFAAWFLDSARRRGVSLA